MARAADGREILAFETPAKWSAWLKKNHTLECGVWLRFFRKDSGTKSIDHAQALDEALCYGWIDGRADPWDGKSWIQSFTPRRKRSNWSLRNIGHFTRLKKEGRVQGPGLRAYQAAKADGRIARSLRAASRPR